MSESKMNTEPEEPLDELPIDHEASSLRRELLAILFLYAVAAIAPLLIGLAFGPA